MKVGRFVLAALILVGASAEVRADLSLQQYRPGSWPGGQLADASGFAPPLSTSDPVPADAIDSPTEVWAGNVAPTDGVFAARGDSGLTGDGLGTGSTVAFDQNPQSVVEELPPVPSSLSLVLSALVSAGGWHLLRSARHWHLGALPAWYHTGGPDQVGHTVVFVFDFDFSSSPLCCFEQPVGEHRMAYRVPWEFIPYGDRKCFLIITAPRGPPSFSGSALD